MSLAAALLLAAAAPATPLFASDAPIRISIRGPVGAIARAAEASTAPRPASLAIAGTAETHAIQLSARGISRRKTETCQFPPLRVEFTQKPPQASLFDGQGRLKLVTHCRSSAGFQQHLLLEYAAYRIFNLVDPLSYRVRLAAIDYVEPDGRPMTSRLGFFIEDLDDAARRNGVRKAMVGDRISAFLLDPRQAARVALFQHMIGNLDWSMRAGPVGEGCCHNARLVSAPIGSSYLPLAYDFDFSGLVDAPYAVPPESFHINSVRSRVYQGYCRHNGQALAAAADFRAARPAIESMFDRVPQMQDSTRRKALNYIARFYDDIATDAAVGATLFKSCVN